MYYKIINTESEVFKKLHEMRTKELAFEEENKAEINKKVELEWDSFLGYNSQQTWNRVTEYIGFKFNEPEKVDLTIWKEDPKHKGIFIPNRRTKKGKEMAAFLNNGLQGHRFDIVFQILGIEHRNKFNFPFVEICKDVIILFLGEDYNIESEDIIEITKKEFYEIHNSSKL